MVKRNVAFISKHTKVTRANLVDLLNEAIGEINKIHDLYDQFFKEADGSPSRLNQIEQKLTTINNKFADLFEGVSPTRIEAAENALEEIRTYHAELLEGKESIKADIKDSQDKITAFYNKLFSKSDGTTADGGQEKKVNDAVKSITDFDALLNADTTGYKSRVEVAKADILAAHSSLFGRDKKSNKTKVELLDEQISGTHEYYERVQKEIKPYIESKQTEIEQVSTDIRSKQSEVDSLLSKTTVKTLQQAYMEAMRIYGDPVYGKFPTTGRLKQLVFIVGCIYQAFKHFIKFLGSYALFIGPLILIGGLFLVNIKDIFGIDIPTGNVKFNGTEYIFYKLTIALPLLWVSWYGQRSISHRKRLFEEYNHKLRVVQMYMLFTAQEGTYSLEAKTRKTLEVTLLETIARNPSEVYGKDETMLDKLIDIFSKDQSKPKADNDSAIQRAIESVTTK